VTTPVASNTLSVNVFTAPGKAMVGERPRPFGEALAFDPITSTLIFGEHDAVLVDAMMTVAEAEALADWIALHNRNLETICITHAHFDHFRLWLNRHVYQAAQRRKETMTEEDAHEQDNQLRSGHSPAFYRPRHSGDEKRVQPGEL
jgi:glyoxylase-like metal-dependent hydrolase (beta-lactamase superfamily II)